MPANAPSALLSRHHRLSRLSCLSRLLRCLLPGVLLRCFLLAAFCFAVCLFLRLHAAACSAATCIAVSCSPPARRPALLLPAPLLPACCLLLRCLSLSPPTRCCLFRRHLYCCLLLAACPASCSAASCLLPSASLSVCLSLRLHAAACFAATCIAVSCSPPARRPAPLPSASLSVSLSAYTLLPVPPPPVLLSLARLLPGVLLRRSLGSLRAGSRLRSRHFRFRSFFSAPFPFDLCLLLLLFLRFYRLLFHGLLPPLRLSPAPSFSSFPPPSSAPFSPLLSSFSPFPRPFRLPAACSAPPHTKTPPPITAGVRNVAREPITPRVFRGRC